MNAIGRLNLSTGRHPVLLGAVLALLATIAPAVSTSLTPQAEAVTNRRICLYVSNAAQTLTVPGQGSFAVRTWVGVNYKKDGACPTISSSAVQGMPVNAQPVSKIVCENWGSRIGASGGYLWGSYDVQPERTGDPCTRMGADRLIHFRVRGNGVAYVAYAGSVR
ncbi:hypothetical protein G7043_35300 [Lentzea sp. NEAU-D13]|uniref:Uncharacterized protein n=1 Tax=Lentzea alba TaxID=2714351 RepID=A0A7C9VVJ7_9PSEU|nr:hypothetical protein [Lentzea alba]NGY64192.1 hypothetical protein [Lentzea alba]